mmetsp:Transcript_19938/g.52539  ORF Transcript_19938/g.52539 Transcript_19938/m.52539 type:complete len:87 (-) Transcript_19938:173-433(-)
MRHTLGMGEGPLNQPLTHSSVFLGLSGRRQAIPHKSATLVSTHGRAVGDISIRFAPILLASSSKSWRWLHFEHSKPPQKSLRDLST